MQLKYGAQRSMHAADRLSTHTRLPEASFLGLSVKPYIHTADINKEGKKQRVIIPFNSMQKQQKAVIHLN